MKLGKKDNTNPALAEQREAEKLARKQDRERRKRVRKEEKLAEKRQRKFDEKVGASAIRIKETGGDKVFNIVNLVLLTIILIVTLYPLIFVISASISNPEIVSAGKMYGWPVDISWDGYQKVFSNERIWRSYANTIFYTVVGTALNLVVTMPAAYALSRKDFVGRHLFTTIFLITMFFSGGLIPTYLLMTQTLHINETIWVMILPGATTMNNIVIARTFFQTTIPDSLKEAAEIDGCSNFRLFISIILPLSGAIIAVIGLFFGVTHWNSYFNAMIYLNENGPLVPLQIVLRQILIKSEYDASLVISGITGDVAGGMFQAEQVKYALIIVASVPVMLVYPFIQKHFVQGVMVGSVKG